MAAPQLWSDAYDVGEVADEDLLALWGNAPDGVIAFSAM